MSDFMYGLGKVVFGTTVGVVFAELFAIGANAAVGDIKELKADIGQKLNPQPEPVKARGFKKKNK